MKRISFFFLLLISMQCSLHKAKNNVFVKGVVLDRHDLDGCSWLIQLDQKTGDGTEILMPLNLEDFVKLPQAGQILKFEYATERAMSTCMGGLPVRLLRLH